MSDDDICGLCGLNSELRKSHIIPRSLIRLIRDETLGNRFYELHNRLHQRIQDGPKEYLLCDDCEQRIGRFEKYFVEAIHYGRHGTEKMQGDQALVIDNLDYRRMKLFFLSLLWRMSISSRPEFQAVCIEHNEEIIRKMLLRQEPGESSEYSVCAVIPLISGENNEGWSSTCLVSQSPPPAVYALVLGGILYYISTSREKSPYPEDLLLNESGRWIIPFTDFNNIPFLRDYIAGD